MNQNILLKCGAIIQEGLEGEADAIKNYCNELASIAELSVDVAKKCAPVIEEIIADELNHQNMLHSLFQEITGIIESSS